MLFWFNIIFWTKIKYYDIASISNDLLDIH